MKSMKRLFLCLFAILLCLSIFSGCKKGEEVPNGYLIATRAGEPFRLYIPSTWNSTVEYGVSGGYYNLSTTSILRAERYSKDSDIEPAAFYEASLRPALTAVGQDLVQAEEPRDTLLGELSATRFHETATVSEKKIHFITYLGAASESFYVLTFSVDDSILDRLRDNIDGIVKNFKLADPYGGNEKNTVREPNEKVEAPAGMKLVSSDDVFYRFFVPETWQFDKTVSICEAHNSAGDASLSVVPYLPETTMTVSEFLQKQNGQLITIYGAGYEKLSETETTLGGRTAYSVEYKIATDGKTYRVKAIFAAYRGMIYTLTYTACEDAYELFLADAGQAISAFIFR